MATQELLEEAEFWLPSDFLSDEDIIIDENKENLKKNGFPYDFHQEQQLAELTRQLTLQQPYPNSITSYQGKTGLVSGSPQSTLLTFNNSGSGTGSSNGGSPNSASPSLVSSPPTTPFCAKGDSCWYLSYQSAGAGEVIEELSNGRQYRMFQNQSTTHFGWVCPAGNVGSVKKQCAGTGVFLPRSYVTINNHTTQTVSTNNPETLMDRRNALLMQQSRDLRPQVGISYETRLPQEWTY